VCYFLLNGRHKNVMFRNRGVGPLYQKATRHLPCFCVPAVCFRCLRYMLKRTVFISLANCEVGVLASMGTT